MHTFLLSIGSNTYAKRNIEKAKKALQVLFPDIVFTPAVASKPYGKKYKRPFLNVLAVFQSSPEPEKIIIALKEIEKRMGRLPADKEKGRIVIDIDLIKKDNTVLRPKDFEPSYVQELLKYITS